MWCSRRSFLTLAAAALGGCGFSPVYAPGGAAERLRGQVLADPPTDREAFDFVARLEDRIGRGDAATYAMRYAIETEQQNVGITPGQETTRYNVVGTVRFTLVERATDRVVYAGTADAFTGYSTTSSIVSTLAAAADARTRLMTALADQVVTELIATAPRWQA